MEPVAWGEARIRHVAHADGPLWRRNRWETCLADEWYDDGGDVTPTGATIDIGHAIESISQWSSAGFHYRAGDKRPVGRPRSCLWIRQDPHPADFSGPHRTRSRHSVGPLYGRDLGKRQRRLHDDVGIPRGAG